VKHAEGAQEKKVYFESINGTRLALHREEDGEVLLQIFHLDGKVPQADVYIDPATMIAKLKEVMS
jgi:hypothetical protein